MVTVSPERVVYRPGRLTTVPQRCFWERYWLSVVAIVRSILLICRPTPGSSVKWGDPKSHVLGSPIVGILR